MQLAVEKRDTKKSTRALRKAGFIPAVVYGRSEESTPVTINRKSFDKVFHEAGESTVVTLTGLESEKNALIHEVEQDPVTGATTHADFYVFEKGQKVTVAIPFEFEGESPAVKDKGGILVKVMHELEITCEPKDLPRSIVVDITALTELDSQIKIKDLTLPATAEITIDTDEVIAMIDVAKEEPVEDTPVDLSSIEISEERGKKEEEPEAGAAEGDK